MNVVLGAPGWLIAILFLVLAAAAVEDAWRLRISNFTCLAVLILAVVAAALHGFSLGMWQNIAVLAALLALGTLAFSAGALGGGDVKLLAALGLWTDIRGAIWLIATVFIAGGLLALLFIAGRKILQRPGNRDRRKNRIPYGIAIAAGALISFTAGRVEQGRLHQPHLPPTIVPLSH